MHVIIVRQLQEQIQEGSVEAEVATRRDMEEIEALEAVRI